MTLPADLIRAVAHALLDVAVASAVLALFAVVLTRIPRVDAATRSRCWSAVAIVPVVALAAALLQPVVPHGPVTAAVPAYAGALLVDPLDAIQQRGMQHAWAVARPLGPAHASTMPQHDKRFPWLMFAVALWLAIAAARIASVLVSIVRAHRIGAGSYAEWPDEITADAADARVELRARDDVEIPIAVGITRRMVIVPSRLLVTLKPSEARAVVLHEIAHLARRDDWVYLLERVACAVLWFDPVVHFAVRASSTWREIACDARAARATGARACATALYRSASMISTGSGTSPALAFFTGGTLVDRVETLLRPGVSSAHRAAAATLALALLATTTSALIVIRAPAYAIGTSGALAATGPMHTRRASFAAVKLRDGRVLIAGGMIANHNFTANAELYDPVRGTFETTGSLLEGRTGLTGTLLPDGRVLIAGGWTSHGVTASTEIYDPATGRFTGAATMHVARAGQTSTVLRDHTILIAGGTTAEGVTTARAEVYDPRSNAFAETAPLHDARVTHTATLLSDGRVLIAGGLDGPDAYRSTELFDPATRTFALGPAMREPRSKHAAALLADGSVLMIGGGTDNSWRGRLNTAERYEPAKNRFVETGPMREHRFKLGASAARLPNGDVLVAGGADRAEVYEAGQGRFHLVDGTLGQARNLGAAVPLDDGSVLIAGGYASVDPLPTTETALRYR